MSSNNTSSVCPCITGATCVHVSTVLGNESDDDFFEHCFTHGPEQEVSFTGHFRVLESVCYMMV